MSKNSSCRWKTAECNDAMETILCTNPSYKFNVSINTTTSIDGSVGHQTHTTDAHDPESQPIASQTTSDHSYLYIGIFIGVILACSVCICVAGVLLIYWSCKKKKNNKAEQMETNVRNLSKTLQMTEFQTQPKRQMQYPVDPGSPSPTSIVDTAPAHARTFDEAVRSRSVGNSRGNAYVSSGNVHGDKVRYDQNKTKGMIGVELPSMNSVKSDKIFPSTFGSSMREESESNSDLYINSNETMGE